MLVALPSPVFAVYLHVIAIVVVVMAMLMIDESHCPWVIYNNDLYGAVQCSWQGRSESYIHEGARWISGINAANGSRGPRFASRMLPTVSRPWTSRDPLIVCSLDKRLSAW